MLKNVISSDIYWKSSLILFYIYFILKDEHLRLQEATFS